MSEKKLGVVVQAGAYQCSECLCTLCFERDDKLLKSKHQAVGTCTNQQCWLFEVRLLIPLQTIEATILPADPRTNPHDPQDTPINGARG